MKNKYIVLALMAIIIILTTATVCNKCSIDSFASIAKEGKQSIKQEDDLSQTHAEEEKKEHVLDDVDNYIAPSIELKVYQGPMYSEEDNICYYRVEAKVTGIPEPEVHFSKDDSNGAWGQLRVQVNLKKDQSYTLVATAQNVEGEAEDRIVLIWEEIEQNISQTYQSEQENQQQGSDEEEIEQDQDNGEEVLNQGDEALDVLENAGDIALEQEVPSVVEDFFFLEEESGWFISGQDGTYYFGEEIYAGDTGRSEVASNRQCSGFMVFDISSLQDKVIQDVFLTCKLDKKSGDTSFYDNFVVRTFIGDVMTAPILSLESADSGEFIVGDQLFFDTFNEILANGQQKLEIYFDFFPYVSNNNNIWDGWIFKKPGVKLVVRYQE